ncbi:MAG TPA: M56 family metallopeptidase [Candidatus Acidoferrum sp.]|nr:M56 family metallopeptidase [Candidatus Acidoferrum sp.]
MRILASGISPELLRALGWTLLHFVWQGAALAALFALANAICRRATTRYALAVTTLVLMMAAPVLTFIAIRQQTVPAVTFGARGASASAVKPVQGVSVSARLSAPTPETVAGQPAGLLWFVEAWFLGVVLLSLRTAGGLFVIERTRRKEIKPVAQALYEKCAVLQRKMGIDRVIQYCECLRLDAPAVLGWFRPVVLLPARALTGLTEAQIEAVIAHELAHIRRLDCFVNLFQIGVETLLFYHPAVWWVSQRIRSERENCCDDEAIAVCGDAVSYARALTLMEEWRTTPSLMMAANRSPLSQRVLRLLGLDGVAGRARAAGLAAGIVCLAGALLAGNAFLGVAHAALGFGTPARQDQGASSVIVVRPTATADGAKHLRASEQAGKDKDKDKNKDKDEQKAAETGEKKESYLDAMEAAGFKNLTADELIAMKVQGITPAYVREIREQGFQPNADELIGMKVQGITPEYIREMRTIDAHLSVDQLIGMKVQGITPQYAQEMRGLGLETSPDSLIGMKVQGITPEYVKGVQALGFKPSGDDLIGMKVQGITPEYVKGMQGLGLKPSIDDLIGMKVQGITPEYVKAMQAEGFKDIDCDELIGAKVQGITPEYVEKARKHGFQNLTLDKLIALKNANVL